MCTLQAGRQWDRVAETTERMLAEKVPLTAMTYTALITGCAEQKIESGARSYWAQMNDEGIRPQANTYVAYISALSRCGHWEEALQVRTLRGWHA